MGVVPNLVELGEQTDKRFPNRDKTSDGTWGDKAHSLRPSSHNGDESGEPEWRDSDSKDEWRARDIDKDLKDPTVTMEDVVQLWVKLARAGLLPYLRYIIFNRRIWHKSDGFKTRVYTGSNPHDKHAHVNSDFSQEADEAKGTNWHLNDLGKKPATPKPTAPVVHVLKEGSTGNGVYRIQDFFRKVFPSYRSSVSVNRGQVIRVDGHFGPQTTAWVKEFQKRTHLTVDGEVGPRTMAKLRSYGCQ